MDEFLRIGFRVLFAYIFLHQLLYHTGYRSVASGVSRAGEGSSIHFVLVLIIGDLIDDLLWAEVLVAQFVVAAGTLAVLHVLVGLVRLADMRWWRLTDGTPAGLLENGIPEQATMRAHRVNELELTALLRREGIARDRWPEIRVAYLENSGKLSILRHPWAKPATRADREQALKAR